jgi:hypothetical protein
VDLKKGQFVQSILRKDDGQFGIKQEIKAKGWKESSEGARFGCGRGQNFKISVYKKEKKIVRRFDPLKSQSEAIWESENSGKEIPNGGILNLWIVSKDSKRVMRKCSWSSSFSILALLICDSRSTF